MEHDNQNAPARSCSASSRKPCFTGPDSVSPGPVQREPAETAEARPAAPGPDLLPVSPQQLLADDSVKMAVLLTAQIFRLSRETVITTVLVGLPVMSRLAEVNPLLLARLSAGSRRPLLTSIERFYARLAESPFLHQALLDDHRATYGGMLDSANRAAGEYAGITDGQAQGVLATLLPALNHTLGQASAGDEREYARQLRALGA